ncbi:MAG TPA: hypothetical protein VMI10_01275 [Terriglobales bacterium]|nr:hypothetical protein [Terriglobales bacterium]
MKKSKSVNFGCGLPASLKCLPLAWNWHDRKIDDKSLREFAKCIHWMMQTDPSQAGKDVLNLLRQLVEKAVLEEE